MVTARIPAAPPPRDPELTGAQLPFTWSGGPWAWSWRIARPPTIRDVERPTEHEVLAAVLQIRDGTAAGAGLAAGPAARLRALGAARRAARRRRGRRAVGAAPARREGRRARGHPRRAARRVQPAGPGARRPADRHRVPRAGAVRRRPGGARRTRRGTRSPRCRPPRSTTPTIVAAARDRLRAKLSYTNLGFALAPREFTISALRELYVAALGHPVSATNLQRVLTRRGLLEPTGAVSPPGPAGGRPAALFRFTDRTLRVTDAFAVLRPPGEDARAAVP